MANTLPHLLPADWWHHKRQEQQKKGGGRPRLRVALLYIAEYM